MQQLGKGLILFGAVIVVIGVVVYFAGRANLPLGRLPGDITYKRGNFTFYAPLATCILLSIILSLVLFFLNRR
jgi:hypothetical protein